MAVGVEAIHQTDPAQHRGDVILVHGLDGDATTTWQPKGRPQCFWPAWLAEDLPDLGIWTLSYDAPVSQWRRTGSPLIDLATASLSTLDAHGIGRQPVVFVAHSFGGLLVKQMLRHATSYGDAAWFTLHDQVRGVVFLSTPHGGSQAANWFLHVGSMLRTSISVKEIEAHNAQLRDLNLWFRHHVQRTGLRLQVYVEQRPTHGIQVVDPTSADPGIVGITPLPIDADHVSIAKPEHRSALVYRGIWSFVDECCAPQDEAGIQGTPEAIPVRTFLIADVRGYTHFTAEHGDEAAARLAGSFAGLVEEVVAGHEGKVIELRGDEALCAFPSARNALRASVAMQSAFRAVVEHDSSLPLQVGMGLDAGEAIPVMGGYRGGALNLAARLCSIAGAGEIFSSETVIGLARKTEGIAFVDRGEVTLKGLTAPVRIVQIAPEGELPETLPPLQPILVTHPTNLPDEPTPFIGREGEIAHITSLLRDPHIRLVTLTGPGGTGKTRLALQVGTTLLYDFRDGVFFVNLAPLTDPTLVSSAVAEVLAVKEEAQVALSSTLINRLHDKHLLLVLDNFEHLLDGCRVVATLLDGCRDVHILVTSRIPLHLSREHEHAVPPLSIPDPQHVRDAASLSQYESTALFVQRAKAAKDSFIVTGENAPAVAEICSRLDGLPLAIELAAARIKLFPPQALLQRLTRRLTLLTGGARDRPTRQQTLRGAIDWSYSLLTESEQLLFARLSVFAGGWTFEAAEMVCNADGQLDLLETMASLVDKSLVRQDGEEEPRFAMLETIREYALERLEERGETEAMRSRHARHFVHLPDQVGVGDPGQWTAEHPHGLKQVEAELENLRAALDWCQARGEGELGLRLVTSLFWLWEVRGYSAEGRRWAEALLAHRARADRGVQARALWVAGNMAARMGDFDQAGVYFEESLALSREVGDTSGVSWALLWLGNVAARSGDDERAVALEEEGREVARQAGERWVAAIASGNLAVQARRRGDLARAQELFEEALAVYREAGHRSYVGRELCALAAMAFDQGNLARGRTLLREAFQAAEHVGDRLLLTHCLVATAGLAVQEEEGARAAWLLGAAEAARVRIGAVWEPGGVAEAARAQVGELTWRTAWQEGRATPLEQAVAAAAAYIAGEEAASAP